MWGQIRAAPLNLICERRWILKNSFLKYKQNPSYCVSLLGHLASAVCFRDLTLCGLRCILVDRES